MDAVQRILAALEQIKSPRAERVVGALATTCPVPILNGCATALTNRIGNKGDFVKTIITQPLTGNLTVNAPWRINQIEQETARFL